MTISELAQRLEYLPTLLYQLLIDERAASLKVAALREQAESEDDAGSSFTVKRAKLEYEHKRASLEIEIRASPPDDIKLTEAAVSAYILADSTLYKMRQHILDLEERDQEDREIDVTNFLALDELSQAVERKDELTARIAALHVEVKTLAMLVQLLKPTE